MVDFADKANALAQMELDSLLQNAKLPDANDVTKCIDCGVEISANRKKRVPYTKRCINCAELSEKKGRR